MLSQRRAERAALAQNRYGALRRGLSVPHPALRRRYADAPSAALLTGLRATNFLQHRTGLIPRMDISVLSPCTPLFALVRERRAPLAGRRWRDPLVAARLPAAGAPTLVPRDPRSDARQLPQDKGQPKTALWRSHSRSILRSSRTLPNHSEAILLRVALLQCTLQIFVKREPRLALLPAGDNDFRYVIERTLDALGRYRFWC